MPQTDYSKHNQEVTYFLNSYLAEQNVSFALLVKGAWGAGKTYFIKYYIENKEQEEAQKQNDSEKTTFCYVSLFHATSLSDIDHSIITEANPLLHSPTAKALGSVAQWVCKKIPTQSIMSMSLTGDDIASAGTELISWLSKFPEKIVIVLDDLERSSLAMKEVLGYVDNLLHRANAKVIIVCNDEKLADAASKQDLKKFQEKVVGSVLSVEADPEMVFNSLIKKYDSEGKTKEIILKNKELILDIFKASQCGNLRHFDKIFFNIKHIFPKFESESYDDEAFVKKTITIIAILSCEYYSHGREQLDCFCLEHNFASLPSIMQSVGLEINDKEEKELEDHKKLNNERQIVRDKYSSFLPKKSPVYIGDLDIFFKNINDWGIFFESGVVEASIQSLYKDSLLNEHQEAPIALCLFFNLSESDYNKYYRIMQQDIKDHKYKDCGLILQTFANLLAMSKMSYIKIQPPEIKDNALEYIARVKDELTNFVPNEKISASFHGGDQFYSQDTEEFQAIYKELETHAMLKMEKADDAHIASLFSLPYDDDKITEAVKFISSDIYLGQDHRRDAHCILEFIDVELFFKFFLNIKFEQKRGVYNALLLIIEKNRHYKERHSVLKEWCDSFLSKLKEEERKTEVGYKKGTLNLYINWFSNNSNLATLRNDSEI